MALQYLKTACIVVSTVASVVFISPAKAGDEIELARQDTPLSAIQDIDWSLRLPQDDKVVYNGVVSFDSAGGGTAAMQYPVLGVAGFFAAVITHGLLVESGKNRQKNAIQKKADEVLLPYQPVLSNYTHQELMREGLMKTSTRGNKKLVAFSEKPGLERLVESTPVFSLTQDQSAIVLENIISIYYRAAPTAVYQNIIKVVSQAKAETDLVNFWTANQGEKLKEESTRLFADSLDIALNDMASDAAKDGNPQKTFRYLEGRAEKMERGQLVSERCGRAVIKTLRGGLMSIPLRLGAAATPNVDQCGDALSKN